MGDPLPMPERYRPYVLFTDSLDFVVSYMRHCQLFWALPTTIEEFFQANELQKIYIAYFGDQKTVDFVVKIAKNYSITIKNPESDLINSLQNPSGCLYINIYKNKIIYLKCITGEINVKKSE